jgi:hypothetical protein
MTGKSCLIKIKTPDLTGVEVVYLQPKDELDHGQAKLLADAEAARRYEEYMLVSWYDLDRDLESPPHATEGPEGGPTDGYIHYALSHGAALKVDVAGGRFVFFYTPVEW